MVENQGRAGLNYLCPEMALTKIQGWWLQVSLPAYTGCSVGILLSNTRNQYFIWINYIAEPLKGSIKAFHCFFNKFLPSANLSHEQTNQAFNDTPSNSLINTSSSKTIFWGSRSLSDNGHQTHTVKGVLLASQNPSRVAAGARTWLASPCSHQGPNRQVPWPLGSKCRASICFCIMPHCLIRASLLQMHRPRASWCTRPYTNIPNSLFCNHNCSQLSFSIH